LASNSISTRNKAANDICPAKAHPQSLPDSNTTNNTSNTTGFPNALSLTPPPRTPAVMAAAKTKFPSRPTKASNLNSVLSLTPPEGPEDDLTAEQVNKMTRATLYFQQMLNFPALINEGSVTAALHKWKHYTRSYHHITETANTIAIKVVARAEQNIPIETSAAGAQYIYTKIKHTDTIQCFLKGPTPKSYTIEVPSPVTLDELFLSAHVPFRLSCKTLDTSYVHRHSSPSLLASIRSVLLAPVLPTQTALPSDDDNGPLQESGSHGYSRSTPDPKHRGVAMNHALSPLWLLAEKSRNGRPHQEASVESCETVIPHS
jgi:hypothetical protein